MLKIRAVDNVQFWLLGYEFPTTLMLFTTETLYILTTTKKGAIDTRNGLNKD